MKKRLRNLFYTSLVLVAVIGLIYTLKLDTSTPQVTQYVDDTPTLVSVEETAQSVTFTHISYTVGDVGLQFTLDEQGQWIWMDVPSFPLDGSYIDIMSQGLDVLSPQQTIVLDDTHTLDDYGLDNPWATVTAVRPDESTYTFAFGNATSDEKAHYALKNGDETTVYIYGTSWLSTVNLPIYDMCLLPTLPTLSAENLQSVVIGKDDTSTTVTLEDGDTWLQGDREVDAPDLLGALSQFQLEQCFSFMPSEKAVTICGFDDPSATVSVTYLTQTQEQARLLLYFGTLAMDETYRYVRYNTDDTIYLVNATVAEQLFTLGK